MPRAGGESDKLGNRYEAFWTIAQLLDLAGGDSVALMVEPFGDEALGIEFIVTHDYGTREFHSAKRQRAQGEWSLAVLARSDKTTGRSILGDLCSKLSANTTDTCYFVSSTGANALRELTERAAARKTYATFQADLNSKAADPLRQSFEKYALPVTSDWEAAYDILRRTRVVLIDEETLKRHVERGIAYLVYRLCAGNYPG